MLRNYRFGFVSRSVAIIVFGLMLFGRVSWLEAQEKAIPPEPRQLLETTVDKVRETVSKERSILPAQELDQKLRQIITPAFNFDEMSKSCLGPHWNTASNSEREEFVKLFSELLARTYLKKIRDNVEESKITVLSESKRGNNVLIRTAVESSADTVAINYNMCNVSGGYQVCDVIVENIGLVSNYRQEFGGIIKRDGFSGLLNKLRDKQQKTV